MGQLLHAGCGEAAVLRGRLRAAGEVQHELHHRDQLDGRARLQAEEPRGAGGGQGQGSLGEACGEYYDTNQLSGLHISDVTEQQI